MKLLSSLCLVMAMTSGFLPATAQATNNQTPAPVVPSTINSATVQSLIQSNAGKLAMYGITPTDAQNIANEVLPQLQNGTTNQVQVTQTPAQNNPPAPNPQGNNNSPAANQNQNNPPQSDVKKDEPPVLPHPVIFGQSFFRDKTITTFNHSTDNQASDDYILGVGDKLAINIWGYTSFTSVFTIDETGAIFPTQTGKIFLKGMTYGNARSLIRSKFSSVFNMTNSELEVILTYSRVITVNIVGEVFNPGSYTLPAINTAFNALMVADGPTNIGSLRKIYVKRAGQTIKTLDVYQFLLNPDSKEDFYLQDNDYIFVPSNSKVISITGEVLRPNNYELLDNENLNSLISFTGGLTPKAFLNNIVIQRYDGTQTKLISLNLDSLIKVKSDFVLKNGDQITINSIPDLIVNQIKVNGPVTSPGSYSFKNGQRISDVLDKNPLRQDALLNKGYIIRTNTDLSKQYIAFSPESVLQNKNSADNLVLKNEDVINFFSKGNFNDNFNVTVTGAVRNPGDFLFGNGMSLNDALYFAGGLKPEAANNRVEIARIIQSENGGTFTGIPVIIKSISIGKDLSLDEAASGFELQPNDIVTVRTASEYDRQSSVSVTGEVLYPGNYTLQNKLETFTSMINRAGGITTAGYTADAYISRKQDNKGLTLSHLDRALKKPGSKYDYILRPGDEITIPKQSNTVTLSGMLKFPYIDSLKQINVPYSQGKRAKYYIKYHGLGFEKSAKRSRTYVVNPGQNVNGCRKFVLFNIFPKVKTGSTIVVTSLPPKEARIKRQQTPLDWNKTISTFTVSLTGIATLYILLTKLK